MNKRIKLLAKQAGRMNKRGKCLFGTMIGRRIEKDFGVEK